LTLPKLTLGRLIEVEQLAPQPQELRLFAGRRRPGGRLTCSSMPIRPGCGKQAEGRDREIDRSSRSWVTKITLAPLTATKCQHLVLQALPVIASSAPNGSSISSVFGSCARQRAI